MNFLASKTLNNGVKIPMLGLGVYKSASRTKDAVRWALEAGYRHIDTAMMYNNEADVAAGIRESGVNRKDIFLTTKLWNDDMRQGKQREAFEKSLELLGTDYVDLYLIHWPVKDVYNESWRIMEELYKQGRARAIGVSNFQRYHLDDLLSNAEVVPAVNQIECHPYLTQQPLLDYCSDKGIAIQAWSPLSRGLLFSDPTIVSLAEKYGKTAAQLIIRWHLQRDTIVFPKSIHKDRIIENANVFDFEICFEDMAAITALNQDRRIGADPDTFTF
jgi:diketogulonate reductase-like aldo/keto reductase